MTDRILLLPILLPLLAGVLILLLPRALRNLKGMIALLATGLNLYLAALLFKTNLNLLLPWAGNSFGFEFSLRWYSFSGFIILSAAAFAFLITLYCLAFMKGREYQRQFYFYLLASLSMLQGAVLADNLLLLLFFWEGMLATMFGMIAIGGRQAFRTATKAFIIMGVCDLCLMLGIAFSGHLAGTLAISKISLLPNTLGSIAFILLMIGAIAKAGSMPFHSWIPDAASDAPLPFMAFFPGALEKLLGIYFLARICLDMFKLTPQSWLSPMLMIIGGLTLLLAVMMALVQKDYKRLLSYHAISQVGYMILGVGTALPIGIIGGLFHMLNNAMYKSCLFLTGGSVEKQAGTTALDKLGGLGKKMPITFVCFFVTALSISGVPPFNGFFSKELIYDAALERGLIFYILAVAGSFFTAASFLKLGHAAFLGKIKPENSQVKEAPLAMLFPMIIIAAGCLLFGVYNALPLNKIIAPALGWGNKGFAGMPANIKLVIITLIVLIAALLNHLWGANRGGEGLKAVDHIHHAPVLSAIYAKAEKRFFDPYDIGLKFINLISAIAWWCDRLINSLYDTVSVRVAYFFTYQLKKAHTGNYSLYLAWSLAGMVAVVVFLLR